MIAGIYRDVLRSLIGPSNTVLYRNKQVFFQTEGDFFTGTWENAAG
jgi:hypothetical protein